MPLRIKRVEVRDYRNYKKFVLEPSDGLTLIVGPNAVGKTNLIESVELLTAAESFRKPQWSELVRWSAEKARAEMVAEGDGRHLETVLQVTAQGKREYLVNGKVRRRLVEVAGIIPCVVFTPDDLRLIKDSAEKRRSEIDSIGSQISPAYSQLKREYERVLRQRNQLLRDDQIEGSVGQAWTERLVEVGSRFHDARRRLFERLSPVMGEAHAEIAPGRTLESTYVASWERDGAPAGENTVDSMRKHLSAKAREEAARKTTLSGPHRDDIVFLLNGRDARVYGSQGQQRTIALAWKLGEVKVVTEISGQEPVLLLDDVMSELDEKRRHALTRYAGTVAQTIMTATNTDYFDKDLLERATLIRLAE